MSYNIDNWKTKKLENLVIPTAAFFKHERTDRHPEIKIDAETGESVVDFGEQEIKGVIREGSLSVSEISFRGEGSGTCYDWILAPALGASTGILEAVLIWEGGDSITRLTVKNGVVELEEIEL